MHWKPFHTQVLLVLVASVAGFLSSGWGLFINLFTFSHLNFLMNAWLLIFIQLGSLAYVLSLLMRKKDEFSLFLSVMGSFFLLIGSYSGPLVVLIGMILLLITLYYHRCITLQAPDIPDIRKVRKRI